jgi:hypothetical protein
MKKPTRLERALALRDALLRLLANHPDTAAWHVNETAPSRRTFDVGPFHVSLETPFTVAPKQKPCDGFVDSSGKMILRSHTPYWYLIDLWGENGLKVFGLRWFNAVAGGSAKFPPNIVAFKRGPWEDAVLALGDTVMLPKPEVVPLRSVG